MKRIFILVVFLISVSCGSEDQQCSSCSSNNATSVDDGANLFAANCAKCHGPIETSKKRNKTAAQIRDALEKVKKMQTIRLTAQEIEKIAAALKD